MSRTVEVPHCSACYSTVGHPAWPQTHLRDSAPRPIKRSHLLVHSDEGKSRCIRKRRTKKQSKGGSSGPSKQKASRDDVAGFPLSNTKPGTVYHGFHGLDSNSPPPLPSSSGLSQQPGRLLLLGGKWCQWLTNRHGGGKAAGGHTKPGPSLSDVRDSVCVAETSAHTTVEQTEGGVLVGSCLSLYIADWWFSAQ